MHWDEASQTCVSDTEAEVSIYTETLSSDLDESAPKK